jgi:hypothetical protein
VDGELLRDQLGVLDVELLGRHRFRGLQIRCLLLEGRLSGLRLALLWDLLR